MDVAQRKTAAALLSVTSNSLLVVGKVVVGLATGSVSVVSEAIHSGVDLLASVMDLVAVRASARPADPAHPFGHGKAENIAGSVEALLIVGAGLWIVWRAVGRLLHPQPMGHVGWGVLVMLVSAGVNLLVSRRLFRVSKQTDSVALRADAWHLRTDVWTSVGVMAGLALVWTLGRALPGLPVAWIDPVAAMAVAVLILRAGAELTLQSARDLMDASLEPDEERWIKECIAARRPAVLAFHHLRTRRAGAHRFIEFHLQVGEDMSVRQSHDIAEDITVAIQTHFAGAYVNVHVEPCDGTCRPLCVQGCFLEAAERQAARERHAQPAADAPAPRATPLPP